jgi:hypothetical protein
MGLRYLTSLTALHKLKLFATSSLIDASRQGGTHLGLPLPRPPFTHDRKRRSTPHRRTRPLYTLS